MDTTYIFPFLAIIARNIYYFIPNKAILGPIQLDIISYIVSEIMNYHYAKFHAFIKKINDWCNFSVGYNVFHVL